ncbi:MAG: hypothetical protein NC203_02915 [Firmicutes bacterium]|nr:hypothetical protein [[Eubacterium] siraeum]MCM1487295.1 hypothetical protein [Bacillota bacterium]
MLYWCESCHQEIERVKYCFDAPRNELYLSCPFCGGDCSEYDECGESENGS